MLIRETDLVVIESRVVCSAANERHTAQHLPRLRIVNFRSARRCRPAGAKSKAVLMAARSITLRNTARF